LDTVIRSKIIDNVSSEGFYSFYGKRKDSLERFAKFLKKNPLERSVLEKLKRIIPELSGLSFEELEFAIDILRERDRSLLERVEYVSGLVNLPVRPVGHLLFILDPRSNPPVNGLLKGEVESLEDYAKWIEETGSLQEMGVINYIMLESALCFKKEPVEDLGINARIKTTDFTNLKELRILREEVQSLDRENLKRLTSELKSVHPYVRSVLFSRSHREVVIDGSNIVYSRQDTPDLARLDDLFVNMAKSRVALFPFRVVFDRNIAYTIGGFQQERLARWLSLPQVETYSPADEKIIRLARQHDAVVITYDRYLEHGVGDLILLRPEEIDENLGI